jgi:CheY-like chemotaxis protein
MPQAVAFLSYTRKDDEFFGGYITAFRKTLESAVHVVTGVEDFRLFQDVEGIVLGEQWQKKIADVVNLATCMLPMLSPLFFSSTACRQEVDLFFVRERQLQRDDLILPVYFFTCPKLEKPEETARDPMAVELAKRHMFDWRENATVPLQEPKVRGAVLTLARQVATALERLEDVSKRSQPPSSAMETMIDDSVTRTYGHAKREELSESVVLWVDDQPNDNVWERRALESYGVRCVLATNTDEGQARLAERSFAAVISDFSRKDDRRGGYTLLQLMRASENQTPYFIYSSSREPAFVKAAADRGAQGATNDPDELVAMVIAAIR